MTTQYITWSISPEIYSYETSEKKNYGEDMDDVRVTGITLNSSSSKQLGMKNSWIQFLFKNVFHATSDEKMAGEELKKTCVKWVFRFYNVFPLSN